MTSTNGIELAARFVEKRRDDYVQEHGSYDPSTGMTEFPGDGEEYVGELEEIIEGIRALAEPAIAEPEGTFDPETGIGSWIPQDVIEEAEWIAERLCLTDADNLKEIKSVLRVHLHGRQQNASAAEPMKVMPRGGVERNWWEEYQLLLRRFKKLAKAARQCVEEVDANLAKDDWPVKYRAPFDGLTKLREALPETYE